MELGVLEFGLKNREISSVTCFLRIQVEAFKAQLKNGHPAPPQVLQQWLSIFEQIVSISATVTNDRPNQEARTFASHVSRVAIQACSNLLLLFSSKVDQSEDERSFAAKLALVLKKIRRENHRLAGKLVAEEAFDAIETNDSVGGHLLPQFKEQSRERLLRIIQNVQNGQLIDREVAATINLPCDELILNLWGRTFDKLVRDGLAKQMTMDEKCSKLSELMAKIYENKCPLQLSIEAIEQFKNEVVGFLIPSNDFSMDENAFHVLVKFNEVQTLSNVQNVNLVTNSRISHGHAFLIKCLLPSMSASEAIESLDPFARLDGYQKMDKSQVANQLFVQSENHKLYEMQLWLLSQFHDLPSSDWPQGYIQSLRDKTILTTRDIFQQVTSLTQPGNLSSLREAIESDMDDICLFWLMTQGHLDTKSQSDQQAIQKYFKTTFPIVGDTLESLDGNMSGHESNIYNLMSKCLPFCLKNVFTWQSMNNLAAESRTSSFPRFSNHGLADVSVLGFSPLHLYHIREGRPLEAWWTLENQDSDKTRGDTICFKFESSEVSASNIIMEQLRSGDSSRMRLMAAASSKILKNAPEFLGLKTHQQEFELNRLIKKSIQNQDQSSKIKLLHLMVESIRRSHVHSQCPTVAEALEWNIVVTFCHQNNLDPPLDFLFKCADNDDWLLFTVFGQMYNVSKVDILKALKNFNNQCISDHLKKAFDSSSCLDQESSTSTSAIIKVKKRSSAPGLLRTTLYSKMGIRPQMDTTKSSVARSRGVPSTIADDDFRSVASEDVTNVDTISFFSGNSGSSDGSNIEWPFLEMSLIYDAIIYCSKRYPKVLDRALVACGVQHRNPPLILMAGSIAQSSLQPLDLFYWWLFVSTNQKPPNDVPGSILVSDFLMFLENLMKTKHGLHLFRTGLELFGFVDSPLMLLIQFVLEFLGEKEYIKNIALLKLYQKEFWRLEDNVNPFLDKNIVARISVIIFMSSIKFTANQNELRLLLRHLDFARIQNMFPDSISVPDIRKLYRMVQSLGDIDLPIPIHKLLTPSHGIDDQAVLKVVDHLQERKFFDQAYNFASNSAIDLNPVLFRELNVKAANNLEHFEFWNQACNRLKYQEKANDVLLALVSNFVDHIDDLAIKCYLMAEKCIIMSQEHSSNLKEQSPNSILESEKVLVNFLIQLEQNKPRISSTNYKIIWRLLFEEGNNLWSSLRMDKSSFPEVDIEKVVLKMMSRKVELAQRFAQIFGHRSEQLVVVETCFSLARKQDVQIESLPPKIAILFPENFSSKSISNVQQVLERLSGTCSSSKMIVQKICLHFKISKVLSKTFDDVDSESDPLTTLRLLVTMATPEALTLAKELVKVRRLKDEPVAEIICSELITNLRTELPEVVSVDSSSLAGDSCGTFLSQLRLLNDTAILGRLILSRMKDSSIDLQPMYVVVELYIKAHDCFTMACDIEGISLVLRSVKNLIVQNLVERQDFQAMIRLLMGIGRYSEMTYIFDILKEHHKFELLLGRRIEKVPQLRIALLDSLKGDKEMYPMVALNFSMHREIADMLLQDALKTIRGYRKNMSPMVRDLLERSLADLVDASESYSKASCFNQSRRCALMAQLVALQIFYVDSDVHLLNLSPSNVSKFITHHESFIESMTVADAYNYQRAWPMAVFENVVKKGDFGYLKDMQTHSSLLNEHLLEEIVTKSQSEQLNQAQESNLKKLLTMIPNIEFYARLPRRLINPDSRKDDVYLKDLLRLKQETN